MQTVKLRHYIQLGELLGRLNIVLYVASKHPTPKIAFKPFYLTLRTILRILDTEAISGTVYSEVRKETILLRKKYKDLDTKFEAADAKRLYENIKQWIRAIKNEAEYITCYNFDYDSNLNIYKLETEGVSAYYTEEVWSMIPDIAQRDLEEAGKSLMFECPTASAILGLRAAECMLRQFYGKLLPAAEAANKTWGQMVNELEKAGASNTILYNLRYIKDAHRNPLTHRDVVLKQDEAETIFFLVKQLITEMVKWRTDQKNAVGK